MCGNMLTVCLYLPARLEVGFDETAQTCTEYAPNDTPDTVQRPPYTVWVGASAKGGTQIISLVHSLAVTLKVRAFGDDADGSFQTFLQEEVVLPTLPISTTDYACVGKAVFKALDKYAFDDLLQFIRRVEVVGLIVIVGTADRASSNLKFMRVWRALSALAIFSSVLLVSEACALHQMQRANCSSPDYQGWQACEKSTVVITAAAVEAGLPRGNAAGVWCHSRLQRRARQ